MYFRTNEFESVGMEKRMPFCSYRHVWQTVIHLSVSLTVRVYVV